jgi:thiosulfate/3-mercaptopyruvate sulfurtransferase
MMIELVNPAWISAFIHDRGASPGRERSLLVIEAGFGDLADYRQGHIPGAVYIDANSFERPPLWNLVPLDQLEQFLFAHGIHHQSEVVIYSRRPFAAARLAWVLLYAGVDQVRLLDGGMNAWISAGLDLETGVQPALPGVSFGIVLPAHPEYLATSEQVSRSLHQYNGLLVCVRSWEEFIGETSGYDYLQSKGRIPGSIWGGAIGTADFLNGDGRLRDSVEIGARWRAKGISPSSRILFYCGTGWRASEAFSIALWMGWQDIAVFDGGWLEWSTGGNRPYESGLPLDHRL